MGSNNGLFFFPCCTSKRLSRQADAAKPIAVVPRDLAIICVDAKRARRWRASGRRRESRGQSTMWPVREGERRSHIYRPIYSSIYKIQRTTNYRSLHFLRSDWGVAFRDQQGGFRPLGVPVGPDDLGAPQGNRGTLGCDASRDVAG